jgi:hypothetical protein
MRPQRGLCLSNTARAILRPLLGCRSFVSRAGSDRPHGRETNTDVPFCAHSGDDGGRPGRPVTGVHLPRRPRGDQVGEGGCHQGGLQHCAAVGAIGRTPSDVFLFSKLPEADQQAILRQANKDEFDRYVNHAHMKLRKPMRDERAAKPAETPSSPPAPAAPAPPPKSTPAVAPPSPRPSPPPSPAQAWPPAPPPTFNDLRLR